MDNIVIFGGTFDPVHNGHLTMAEHVITDARAKQCIWVPNKVPLLKGHAQATIQQRLDMLSLAIKQSKHHEKFSINLCEIEREAPSYTVDTLHYFRNQFDKKQSLSLLMGEDAFVQLNQWHEWNKIIDLTHIIVAARPLQALTWPPEIAAFFDKHHSLDALSLQDKPSGFIYQLKVEIDVSSTDIRQHLSQQQSLAKVCPKSVADYISKHRLYVYNRPL